jgi:hypothetical protein
VSDTVTGRLGVTPEAEARLGPGEQAVDVRPVQHDHAEGRQRCEGDHRPRLAEDDRASGSETAAVIDASEA